MRYNKEIQKLADQCAQEEDYLCASYLGQYKNSFVFEPMYEDNSPRCTGFPCLIFVQDGVAALWQELDLCSVYKKTHYRGAAGRRIVERYRRMIRLNNFRSEEHRNYICSIIVYLNSPFASKTQLYQYVEIAERLGKRLEFFTLEDQSQHRYTPDGEYTEQFIRIV